MKAIISIFIFQCMMLTSYSQSITSMSVIPNNPTANDFVKIEVNALFGSGDCLLLSSNQTRNGNVFDITGQYCSGMLAVICSSIDTFNIGYLQPGTYVVRFHMNHYPCDTMNNDSNSEDVDSLTFTVTQTAGMHELRYGDFISVYPNPSAGKFQISIDHNQARTGNIELEVYNVFGEKVFEQTMSGKQETVNLNAPNGIYFVQVKSDNRISIQKIIIQQ